MIEVAGTGDEPLDLVRAEHGRQPPSILRIRQVLLHVAALEDAQEEEPQGGDLDHDRAHGELAVFEQVDVIAPEIVRPDAVETFPGVLAKRLDDLT